MNNKWIYLPVSFFVLISIGLLSMEIPHYGLMMGFLRLLIVAVSMSVVLSVSLFFLYRKKQSGEDLYTMIGITTISSFVIFLAFVSILNRKYATYHCERTSYEVLGYQGRYTSGYGNIEKKKLKANQWILNLRIDDESQQFVLEKDISPPEGVTRSMQFMFCRGILGTKYLHVE